jgi:hypothetical protein
MTVASLQLVDRAGHVLTDPALERALVATAIARGGDPLPDGIDLDVLHDMHAGHAWTAMLQLGEPRCRPRPSLPKWSARAASVRPLRSPSTS